MVAYHIVIVTRGNLQTEKRKRKGLSDITQKFGVIQIALYEKIGNPYCDNIMQSLKSPSPNIDMVLIYEPSTVPSTLKTVSHLNAYEARNYYSHFTDKKIEGQQLYIICSRSRSQ